MNVIKQAVQILANKGDEVYSVVGTVSDVDVDAATCTVHPLNGDAAIYGVKMKANDKPGFMVVPVEGSEVVATFIGANVAYLGLVSEVQMVVIEISEVTLLVDADGLKLNNGSTSFKDQVNDLVGVVEKVIELLETFKVITPAGPSTVVSPDSLAKLTIQKTAIGEVKSKFQNLLT